VPPSLSSRGHIRLGTKSDIAGILENLLDSSIESSIHFDAVVYDGAAMVNILQPKTCRTFGEYAAEVFAPSS